MLLIGNFFWYNADFKTWKMIVDKFTKLSKICFAMECFATGFLQISSKNVKIAFWVGGWVLAIKSKDFSDFFEIS